MRPTRAGRAVVVLLSAALLTGVPAAASAQGGAGSAIAPPSIELGLTALVDEAAAALVDEAAAALALESTELAAGSLSTAAPPLPACRIGDKLTRYAKVKHWKRSMLDTERKVRRSYRPWDLVSVSRANIRGSGKVRKIMIADLRALAAAARRAGKPLAVRSAHRSYDYQQALFDSYVRTYGYQQAIKFSARPGHSEHQLGTTIDFTTAPGVPLSTRFGDSPAGKWLARNGWKFGFVMSYPKGKRKVSCYGYEPWHWRYVGRDLARDIKESGLVPRNYLWRNFESLP